MNTTPSPAAVAAVEGGMLDTCRINAPGTEQYNDETNQVEPVPGALGYTGACTIAEDTSLGSETRRGGEAETERPYKVSIPRDAAPVPVAGHIVTITGVHAEGDPALVDKAMVIRRVRYGTRMARRILSCDLVEATA